jgi:hypothetical protein
MGIRIEVGRKEALEYAALGFRVVGIEDHGRDIYMATLFDGFVLYDRERNGYDDSDFYAVIWNPFSGTTFERCYATTRAYTYNNGCWCSATPEVRAAFDALRERYEAERREAAAAYEASRPDRYGRIVKVVRGRKVPKGTTGEVCWVGTDSYSGMPRVGFRTTDGARHITAASNLEVIPT